MIIDRCSLKTAAIIVFAANALPAAAQTDADIAAAGRACLTIDRSDRRLACFERAFDAAPQAAAAPPPAAPPAAQKLAEPVAVKSAAPAPAPAAPRPVASQPVAAAPVERETAPAAEPARAAEPAGSEEAAVARLQIVDTMEIRPGNIRFESADGALYYYSGSSSRPLDLPDTPFAATLEPGALGSRFLRFGPGNRERVRVSERD